MGKVSTGRLSVMSHPGPMHSALPQHDRARSRGAAPALAQPPARLLLRLRLRRQDWCRSRQLPVRLPLPGGCAACAEEAVGSDHKAEGQMCMVPAIHVKIAMRPARKCMHTRGDLMPHLISSTRTSAGTNLTEINCASRLPSLSAGAQ